MKKRKISHGIYGFSSPEHVVRLLGFPEQKINGVGQMHWHWRVGRVAIHMIPYCGLQKDGCYFWIEHFKNETKFAMDLRDRLQLTTL